MKNLFVFFVFLLFSNQLYSQGSFAVINDSDGYTNVHIGDIHSKIVKKILKYQPFECFENKDTIEHRTQYPNMVYIQYADYTNIKGANYLINTEYENESNGGYIYKNRVYRLNDMPKLKILSQIENKVIYGKSSLKVEIETVKFDVKKHLIKNEKGELIKAQNEFANVVTIDGLQIWGTDGNIPKEEIKSIKIIYPDTTIFLSPSSIKNIFEPNIAPRYTQISVGMDNEIYIWMQNSDGAGSYDVIWVIKDKKLLYRFTRLSYYA